MKPATHPTTAPTMSREFSLMCHQRFLRRLVGEPFLSDIASPQSHLSPYHLSAAGPIRWA